MFSKDRALAFMFICIGILALVVAFSVVGPAAQAQLGSAIVAMGTTEQSAVRVYAMTGSGELYRYNENTDTWSAMASLSSAVPTSQESLGGLKKSFR